MPRLLLHLGTPEEKRFELTPGLNSVGRTSDNDRCIPHPSVSTHHCQLWVTGQSVMVRDLGSTNGTFVDGVAVREADLHSGQTLRLGDVELLFDADTPKELTEIPIAIPPPPDFAPQGDEETAVAVLTSPTKLGPPKCSRHPKRLAQLRCPKCNKIFCPFCVKTGRQQSRQGKFCLECGTECEWLHASLFVPPKDERTFFQLLPGAFAYPLKGEGWISLLTGTTFYLFVRLSLMALHFLVAHLFVFLLIETAFAVCIAMMAYGYLVAYQMRIIQMTVDGRDEVPEWPDFNEWLDALRPFFQILITTVVCLGPGLLVLILFSDEGGIMTLLAPRFSEHFEMAPWVRGLSVTLFLIGALYLPMAFLAVSLFDTVEALNPLFIVPSMLRVKREYLATCGVLLAVYLGHVLIDGLLRMIPTQGMGTKLILAVVSEMILALVGMYALIVEMRILGLLYRSNKETLNWFKK